MEWYWWVYGVFALGVLYQINKQLPIWITAAWAVPAFFGPWKLVQPEAVSTSWWIIIGLPFAVAAIQGIFFGRKSTAEED